MSSDARLPSVSRPLRVRAREDLVIREQWFRGRRFWAVKDPVTLRYFQLREEELAIFRMLDGTKSLDDIRSAFDRRFAPEKLLITQLQSFLAMLHQEGLIVTETSGQAEFLLQRHRDVRSRKLRATLSNPLAIRFHGVDPDRFLGWLDQRIGWVFSPVFAIACLVLLFAAGLNVAMHFEQVLARFPDFQAFFGLSNMVWLVAILAIVKIIHEIGHGLACKHFGSECHELGVMLLVFTPCLYCNVSDAWMMPSKWKRISVSAAGMVVEIMLAAVCSLLWWFSEPGMLNALCLNLVFVCSVSTVLFNGNPLLRYDGYYVLSDWMEVPNLREDSMALVSGGVTKWLTGVDDANPRRAPAGARAGLLFYAVAAFAYRFVVIGGILWFVYQVLKPHDLEVLALALGVLVIAGMAVPAVVRVAGFFARSWRRIMWFRFTIRTAVVVAGLWALAMIPIPRQIAAPLIIEPSGARRVYVTVPGATEGETAKIGADVTEGQTLATLRNPDVDAEIAKLRGERDLLRVRVKQLEGRRVTDRKAEDQLVTVRKQLADAEERLAKRKNDRKRLVLSAPMDGTVLPPPRRAAAPESDQLPEWSGTPVDPENAGAFLQSGTVLCLIGDPKQVEAKLIVDQSDVEFIRKGQSVKLHVQQVPGEVLRGTITEVARVTVDDIPEELISHEDIATRPDESGKMRPVSNSFELRVSFDEPPESEILLGTIGRAKIQAVPQSVGSRVARYLRRTFRFNL